MYGKRKWESFRNGMAAKRKTRTKCEQSVPNELNIQRLSEQVSGKSQKFTRMGPRTFVPFLGENLTIENVKNSCNVYFDAFRDGLICDVLAGEQGPSCSEISQLPNLKVINVRFISTKTPSKENKSYDSGLPVAPKSLYSNPFRGKITQNTPSKNSESSSKINTDMTDGARSGSSHGGTYHFSKPKSLSCSQMLNLGQVVKNKESVKLDMERFDLKTMSWIKYVHDLDFYIDSGSIGEGGFRIAYKATSAQQIKNNSIWVVKKYLDKAKKHITGVLNQSLEEHTKKVVQMHLLAKNFMDQMVEYLSSSGKTEIYGNLFNYQDIYFAKLGSGEYVTIEPFIYGEFSKYINNDGSVCSHPDIIATLKAEAFVHYSYMKSNCTLMVMDIQGSGYHLYDPEIASKDLVNSSNNFMFCVGNLSEDAINNFVCSHSCNKFCKLLCLQELRISNLKTNENSDELKVN